MNTEIKIQSTHIQSQLTEHRKRCIAAFIHERTKAGKPTTCRQICAAHGWHHGTVNSLLHLLQVEPTQTTYGAVIVVPVGKGTDPNGVTAMRYAAILRHEKSANQ